MSESLGTILRTLAVVAALAIPVGAAAQDSPSHAPKLKHHTYKLVDIGTLGGPHSEVNGGPWAKRVMTSHVIMSASDDCLLESEVRGRDLAPRSDFEHPTH